jgi:hypothetical protein
MPSASGRPGPEGRPYHFTDAAKLAIVQARHEALHRGAAGVAPAHLALGVIFTLPRPVVDLLVPHPGRQAALLRDLGGGATAAPVIARDIGYLAAARDALDGATRIAAAAAGGPATRPTHILLGILRPWSLTENRAVAPGEAARILSGAGLTEAWLASLQPRAEALIPD